MQQSDRTKKPYSTPRLEVFGDIREITRNVGATSTPDGGIGATNMSKP